MDRTGAIRWLSDPALPGPVNMARDEALMIDVGEGASPPTLRLYEWDCPTISLGYFQRYADYEALAEPAGALPVVRRLTGGGAILHDLELTYALALPLDHPLVEGGPNRLYEATHDAVIAVLASLGITACQAGASDDSTPTRGPFFCFARRHRFDVLVGDDKIAGSAQRRTRTAVLQHGSIVLGSRFEQHRTARLPLDPADATRRARGILVEQLTKRTGLAFNPGSWSPAESTRAAALTDKYAGSAWVQRC